MTNFRISKHDLHKNVSIFYVRKSFNRNFSFHEKSLPIEKVCSDNPVNRGLRNENYLFKFPYVELQMMRSNLGITITNYRTFRHKTVRNAFLPFPFPLQGPKLARSRVMPDLPHKHALSGDTIEVVRQCS